MTTDKVHVPQFEQLCVCMASHIVHCHGPIPSIHCKNMNDGMSCMSKQASSHTCHLQKQAPVLPFEEFEVEYWQWCHAI